MTMNVEANKFCRLLLDHVVGEFRVGQHWEACMTRDANRLLYVGHAANVRPVGDGMVSQRAEHDHAAGYVMEDVHIVRDSEYPSI
jgi:hypothetical protein